MDNVLNSLKNKLMGGHYLIYLVVLVVQYLVIGGKNKGILGGLLGGIFGKKAQGASYRW